jgi:hypothetical protein
MDTMIEQYLKGNFSLDKQKEILHYIQVNKELKNRFITMAILVRSINNVGYKKNIKKKIKENTWLEYYFKYGTIAQKLLYTNY